MIPHDALGSPAFERALQDAEDALARGEHIGALDRYIALLTDRLPTIGASLSLRAMDAVVIERLAELSVLFGNYSAAADLLSALIAAFAAVGNIVSADYARLKLASVRFAEGRLTASRNAIESLDGARVILDQLDAAPDALAAWERTRAWASSVSSDDRAPADRAVLLTRLYLEIGQLFAATGQFVACLHLVERGLAHCGAEAPPMARRARWSLRLLGARAALERGDLGRAESTLTDATPDDGDTTPVVWEVRSLELGARLALLRGQFGRAKSQFERVIDLCRRGGFQAAQMRATLNLAHTLIVLNQTKVASDLLLQVRVIAAETHDAATQARADALRQLAIARAQSLADAVAITPSVSEQWDAVNVGIGRPAWASMPFTPDLAASTSFLSLLEDRALLFYAILGQRDWPRAEQTLMELEAACGASDSMVVAARLLAMHGMLAYYWSDWTGAYESFLQAMTAFDDLGLVPDLWQCQRFLAWTLRQRGEIDKATELVNRSERLLDQMTTSLDQRDRAIFSLNKWTADEEFLAASIASLAMTAMRETRAPRWQPARLLAEWRVQRGLLSIINHLNRHQQKLSARVLEAPRDSAWRPRRWWRERRDRATIGYLVLPDRLLVACWCGWTGRFAVRPVTRIALREMVAELHYVLSSAGSESDVQRVTQTLSQALGLDALVDSLPPRVTTLRMIADDSLRGVPFAALPAGGAVLVHRFNVVTGFEWFPAQRPRTNAREALVVGVGKAQDQFRALPNVEPEATFVAKWLESHRFATTVLQDDEDDDATRDNVINRLPTAGRVHIACHGIFQPDAPDRSGLILSRGGQPERLSIADLARCDLRQLDLATLSSCWAADSFVLPGRYVISLPYTLWRSGTRSVLAPLWEIDDEVAAHFIQRFYEHLDTQSPIHALRATQLDCLSNELLGANSERQTSHPMHWAGYQLFGRAYGD